MTIPAADYNVIYKGIIYKLNKTDMKKNLFFLMTFLLSVIFSSCGKIDKPYRIIDYSDSCRITTDQKITLLNNGNNRDYFMSSTEDCFISPILSERILLSDSDSVYIYRLDKKFVASKINLEHVRALRNFIAAEKFSQKSTLLKCTFLFLIAFAIGCIICSCRKIDSAIFTVGLSTLIMVFVVLDVPLSSFVSEGTVTKTENEQICVDNSSFILAQPTDVYDGSCFFPGQHIYIYGYDDLYFASGEKFAPATLAYTETIPNFIALYLICWFCAMALGYWAYTSIKKKIIRWNP